MSSYFILTKLEDITLNSTLAQSNSVDTHYSYQHTQGTMLLNLNKLSCEIKLTHSEYRLMGVLIGLWNKNHGKAFPTIEQLAHYCNMGKSTIIKGLENLVKLNLLVVVKTPAKRNNYYFSNLILSNAGTPHVEPIGSTACSTAHDNKQIKNKTNKEQTSSQINIIDKKDLKKNDDDYKNTIRQLEQWNFNGSQFAIKKYGLETIKELIAVTEQQKPVNCGAYLRSLLSNPAVITSKIDINPVKIASTEGKKCEALIHTLALREIREKKPSKEEMINKLIAENKTEDAKILKELWKM
jgi:predicted transcriptional regulator